MVGFQEDDSIEDSEEGEKMNPKFDITPIDAANLLQGLVAVNQAQVKEHIKDGGDPFAILKAIQEGKLRYKRSDPDEHWLTHRELLEIIQSPKNKIGATGKSVRVGADCEDLSAAVAAELREAGIEARTYVYKARPGLFHVIVRTKKWGDLDPSVSAGMRSV